MPDQQPPKSIYERHSGRAASDPSAAYIDKAAHLSASRDPFKPRSSDRYFALLTPAGVFAYNWKRANLSASAMYNFAWLYMVTWLTFAVTAVPWVLRIGPNFLERPAGNVKEIIALWPWYHYVRYAFLVPYALQVWLAVKAWYLASCVHKLAVQRCQDPAFPISHEYDLNVRLFGFYESDPESLLSDLFTMRLQAAELDLDKLLKPPTPEDVGGEEEMEDGLFTAMPALMQSWYAMIRPIGLCFSGMTFIYYVCLATLLGMLFGWPVEYVLQWTTSTTKPVIKDINERYRTSFYDAFWMLLYCGPTSGMLFFIGVICYRFYLRSGITLQDKFYSN